MKLYVSPSLIDIFALKIMEDKMNPKIEEIFKIWLKLNEDEKRDFMKELFYFNNLPPEKQKSIERKYK